VVGVALIVGSYFNLQGWALLLATTPAAILALVAALAILSIDQKNQAQQEEHSGHGFLCWIKSYFISLPGSRWVARRSW
jgi:hypothetical protein